MTSNDRIYSREEFAEILERAEDFERRAEVALGSQPGFSLTQMREIAAEAGIDPDAVERAAHLLPPKAPELPIEHTTRGVLRQRIQASFPVALTAEASAKQLDDVDQYSLEVLHRLENQLQAFLESIRASIGSLQEKR